jgi:hypothetical protein
MSKQKALGAEEARRDDEAMELIPGLPEEVAEKCLLHLPFLYHLLFRTVFSNWNRFLTADTSGAFKPSTPLPTVSLSLPFLFAFAFDPFSRRWLLLPPSHAAGPPPAPSP